MMPKRYCDFTSYMQRQFPGRKLQKISINGGFTCPNRDGSKGRGGCTFCNNQTFSPEYCLPAHSITAQIEAGIAFFARKYPQMEFLAYFQSYTGSYGELPHLIEKYEEALSVKGVAGLIIGTRPDCMPNTLLSYLQQQAKRGFVQIEYGIESTLNRTLTSINRGHDFEAAIDAVQRTHAAGLEVGAHLILGLPGENREELLSHADRLSRLPLSTLKLHQLQLIRGTVMGDEFEKRPNHFHLFSAEEYADLVVDFLERLRPDLVVERFVSQSPKELLIAPDWGLKNYQFTALVERRLRERNTRQGALYRPNEGDISPTASF